MRKFLFTVVYFLSPFLLIFTLYSSNPAKYADVRLLMSMVIASMAYTWLTWQFVLSARPKFIETAFGMDKLYRVHGLMAIISLAIAAIHASVNEEILGESFMTTIGSGALAIFIVISAVTLLLMVTSVITGFAPVKLIINIVNQLSFSRYENYRLLHNLTIVALVLLQIHVLLSSNARSNQRVFLLYMAYFTTAILFYAYHKFLKPWLLMRRHYVVSEVVQESLNMWSVHFTPERGHVMKYKPGQFGFFRILSDHLPSEEHPFTIASSAALVPHISITVKELGDFTQSIKHVKIGDKLILDAPFGRFSHLNHTREEATVFIVGGVGITPAASMMRFMKDHDKNRKILLIWGMNTLDDYIFKDEFEAMRREMPNVSIIPVVAKDLSYEGEKGYIDKKCIERLVNDAGVMHDSTGFYLCGPSILMSNGIKSLQSLGIDKKRIHFEKFSL